MEFLLEQSASFCDSMEMMFSDVAVLNLCEEMAICTHSQLSAVGWGLNAWLALPF
jgi:hypothetical protein